MIKLRKTLKPLAILAPLVLVAGCATQAEVDAANKRAADAEARAAAAEAAAQRAEEAARRAAEDRERADRAFRESLRK